MLPGIPHYIDRISAECIWKETLDKERGLFQAARDQNPGPPAYTINLTNAQRHGQLTDIKINHNRLEVITEKVEKGTPQERNNVEGVDPTGFDINAIRHLKKKPEQKYDLPCTRAQEIGWLIATNSNARAVQKHNQSKRYPEAEALGFTSPPKKLSSSSSAPDIRVSPHLPTAPRNQLLNELNNRRFYCGKTFCPITKYADNYVSTMHHDPFNKSMAGR